MLFPMLENQTLDTAVGKIVCVGRNYAEHAKELNNPVPSQPVLFIKPSTSAVTMTPDFAIPTQYGSVHHELEIALLIGSELSHAQPEEVLSAISGVGLALDLTLRDVQSKLKEKGQPWERAKAFDGAACLSPFVALTETPVSSLSLELEVDGELRQTGGYELMMHKPEEILSEVQSFMTLNDGDVIMTGTPKGVGPVKRGQTFTGRITSGSKILLEHSWTAQ